MRHLVIYYLWQLVVVGVVMKVVFFLTRTVVGQGRLLALALVAVFFAFLADLVWFKERAELRVWGVDAALLVSFAYVAGAKIAIRRLGEDSDRRRLSIAYVAGKTLHSMFGGGTGTRIRPDSPVPEPNDPGRQLLTITERAAARIRSQFAEHGHDAAIRIAISPRDSQPTVCYDLPEPTERDWVTSSHGIVVLLEKTLTDHIEGGTVDVDDEGNYVFRRSDAAT